MKPFYVFSGLALMIFAFYTGWSINRDQNAELKRKNLELEASNQYNWKRAATRPTREAVIIPLEALKAKNAIIDDWISISTYRGWTTQRVTVVFNATNADVMKLLENEK